jgi:hypothetical protein
LVLLICRVHTKSWAASLHLVMNTLEFVEVSEVEPKLAVPLNVPVI